MVDARIAESALATLGNRAERLHVRVRALEAVIGQLGKWVSFGPLIQIGMTDPSTGVTEFRQEAQISWRPGGYDVVVGRLPVTPAIRERLLQSLHEMARAQDDSYLSLAIERGLRFQGASK